MFSLTCLAANVFVLLGGIVEQSKPETDPSKMTEARAYEYYAPDFAVQIDLSVSGYDELWFRVAHLGGGCEVSVVDWGDGAVETNSVTYWGTWIGHKWAERKSYVIRLSNGAYYPIYSPDDSVRNSVIRVLRWPDEGMLPMYCFSDALVSLSDGRLARWPKNAKSLDGTYSNCKKLSAVELPAWPEGLTEACQVYANCTGISVAKLPGWPSGSKKLEAVYAGCSGISAVEVPDWPSGLESAMQTYIDCSNLAVTNLPAWPASVTNVYGTYANCSSMVADTIPAWPAAIENCSGSYYGCASLKKAWTNDASLLMPSSATEHSDCVTGTSDDLRALFYQSWGGSVVTP